MTEALYDADFWPHASKVSASKLSRGHQIRLAVEDEVLSRLPHDAWRSYLHNNPHDQNALRAAIHMRAK